MTFAQLPRSCGILLHPTALPSAYGIGDLGPDAYAFAEALADNGYDVWQMLPTTPTDPGCWHSPYSSTSAFAGNPLLISPERLAADGMILRQDLPRAIVGDGARVDFAAATAIRDDVFEGMVRKTDAFKGDRDFDRFVRRNAWVVDYARFAAFKKHFGGKSWTEWPEEIRHRDPDAVESLARWRAHEIRREMAVQYVFDHQWRRLRQDCCDRGVRIFGDMPIYVQFDSADVWAHPELFRLDADGRSTQVAGVPPDYFSATGQLWGNPLYDWDEHAANGFSWWLERFARCADMYDIVRMDHFRGFVNFWVVEANEKTAMNGQWEPAPAEALFWSVMAAYPDLMIVAEDLGDITADVKKVMSDLEFPGMKIMQFAFGDEEEKWLENPYLPHNISEHSVVYTGTHDNETLAGMLHGASEYVRGNILSYSGKSLASGLHERVVDLALGSAALLAMFPLQDLLELGNEARFNTPGTVGPANWSWRASSEQLRAFRRGIPWFQEALKRSGRFERRD
jgi:4-alpha-glucanotransferase